MMDRCSMMISWSGSFITTWNGLTTSDGEVVWGSESPRSLKLRIGHGWKAMVGKREARMSLIGLCELLGTQSVWSCQTKIEFPKLWFCIWWLHAHVAQISPCILMLACWYQWVLTHIPMQVLANHQNPPKSYSSKIHDKTYPRQSAFFEGFTTPWQTSSVGCRSSPR